MTSAAPHRIYLIPGMFGFAKLAGFDYFGHVRRGLAQRLSDAGVEAQVEVVPTPPTSSLRHRAGVLARTVNGTAGDHGPIHLVGHSTGGLDARLALSPTVNLGAAGGSLEFTRRVRTAISLNTPHYGTPLAAHFATVAGTRMLYALSLLTVVSLSGGEPLLTLISRVVATVGGLDQFLGGDFRLVSRLTDSMLRLLDAKGRGDVQQMLRKIRVDQGGIIQITPEAMDLFNAATEDSPTVRYGSVVTAAPKPSAWTLGRSVSSSYSAMTAAIYATLYGFTSSASKPYPYARPDMLLASELEQALGEPLTDGTNDGVVPSASMLWGKLLWAGRADHLDVLGHFRDREAESRHSDWLTSGAGFGAERFAQELDAVAAFILES